MQLDLGLGSLKDFLVPAPGAIGCPNCSMVFGSMDYLDIHINSTSTMCDLCSTQCCSDINLKNHMEFECDLAKRNRNFDLIAQESAIMGRARINPEEFYNIPIEDDLDDIESLHTKLKNGGSMDVRCIQNDCEQLFNNNEYMQEHWNRDHTNVVGNLIPCGGCEETFATREEIKRHKIQSHPELEEFRPVELDPEDSDPRDRLMTCACPVCERKFKLINTCSVHIKVDHLGWKQRKLFDCTECDRSFANQKLLDIHHEGDHQGIRTMCPLCDKPIKSAAMRGHLNMVHNDAVREWPCNNCGKKFKRKHDLIRHNTTVHLGVRNHPCDLCGKRFGDNKDMVRHRKAVHMGLKIDTKWKRTREIQEARTRRMDVRLEDGSEVSIQQYIEEQGSQVLGDLQGSYPQINFLHESYLQGQQLEGYLQGQGLYGQEGSYLQEQGQGGIGQGLHMAGDEGDSYTLDLGIEEELASMQVPIIPLDITIILIIQKP